MDQIALLLSALIVGFSDIPGVQSCVEFPKRRDAIQLPAILLSMVELEPDSDPGTDELALISHWEARVVMSDRGSEAPMWALVQAALYWLINASFPELNIGRAHIKQAAPDHFTPDFQGHRVWLIEWTQRIRVGENVWDAEGVIPHTISIGWPEDEREVLDVVGEVNHARGI